MKTRCTGHRRDICLFALMFAIASIVFLLVVGYFDINSEVRTNHFAVADSIVHGILPDVEYPPFAIVFLTVPRFFGDTPGGYEAAFVALTYVFFIIGLVLAGKFAKRFNYSQYFAMLAYTVMMLLMLEFLLDRYDIFPMVLTMLSLYCFMTKRYAWAWFILSVATMTKLYPAVLVPVYLMMYLVDKEWKGALKGVAIYVITALVIVLPIFLLGSDMIQYFLGYHMDRPIQLESTASSFISFAAILGLTKVWTEFGSGSDNLLGAWPEAVEPFLTPLMIISILIMYMFGGYLLLKLKKLGRYTENNKMVALGMISFAAVTLFVIVGKVFSAQYLIWIIPFVLFLLVLPMGHIIKRRMLIIFIAAEILTQLNFAVNVGIYEGEFNDIGMLIVLARNLLMIALLILVANGIRKQLLTVPTESMDQ